TELSDPRVFQWQPILSEFEFDCGGMKVCRARKDARQDERARTNLAFGGENQTRRLTMRLRLCALRMALLSSAIAAPTIGWTGPATPTCSDLAANPAWGLAGNPSITGLTATVTPASGSNAAYCQV